MKGSSCLVKEEPEEKQNHSDVGLFVRNKCLLKNTVIFYACAEACDVPKADAACMQKKKVYMYIRAFNTRAQ